MSSGEVFGFSGLASSAAKEMEAERARTLRREVRVFMIGLFWFYRRAGYRLWVSQKPAAAFDNAVR
jgi:hypothetical protein